MGRLKENAGMPLTMAIPMAFLAAALGVGASELIVYRVFHGKTDPVQAEPGGSLAECVDVAALETDGAAFRPALVLFERGADGAEHDLGGVSFATDDDGCCVRH